MKSANAKAQLPGISRAIREINARIPELARRPNDLVFLTGEPGTERALVARLIHQHSDRADKNFVRIVANWKLPPDFAQQLAAASGGTVFISLVREFPVDMQYTLLELALDRTFTDPMTGDVHEADVRLILTTTLDLETLFERSPLLPDLRDILTRSNVDVPALRDRREDIPPLVRFALQRAKETGQSHAEMVDRQVLALFRAYAWPGNAEQLLLVAAQAALKAKGSLVTLRDLPEDFVGQLPAAMLRAAGSLETLPFAEAEPPVSEHDTAEEGVNAEEPSFNPPAFAFSGGAMASSESPATDESPVSPDGAPAGAAEIYASNAEEPSDLAIAAALQAAVTNGGAENGGALETPEEHEAKAAQEFLSVASRLYAQSALLSRQMQGPLPPASETARDIAALRGTLAPPSPELEEELTRGLEQILALRRQLAILNQREQDSAYTIRDLLQRLEMVSDNEEKSDAQGLASHLVEIDGIIERITDRLPRISEDIQKSIRRILGKKRHG